MFDGTHRRNLIILCTVFMVSTVIFAALALNEATMALLSRSISLYSSFGGLVIAFHVMWCLLGVSFLLLILLARKFVLRIFELSDQPVHFWRWGVLLIAVILQAILVIATIDPSVYGRVLGGPWTLLELFWLMFFALTVLFKIQPGTGSWGRALAASIILTTVNVTLLPLLTTINNYPVSLGYSDGELIYFSSLLTAEKIYGMQLPMSLIYPSLALLDSIPFLVGSFPIWVHRFWSVFLTIGLTFTASFCLVRRLKLSDRLLRWLLVGWAFLYLISGGVKYELLVCVIVILVGVSGRSPWRSLISIMLASFWAGMSRQNWYPVPGMLAAVLYLLEEPIDKRRTIYHYLAMPVSWFFFGLGIAFLGAIFTLQITNNDWATVYRYAASRTFWYRLLPSPTYPIGVLPGIILCTSASWLTLGMILKKNLRKWHSIRLFGLGASLMVLFIGGLFVSAKIGGGGDLHNLDAFIVCILIVSAYFAFWRTVPDAPVTNPNPISWSVVAIACLVQFYFAASAFSPFLLYDEEAANQSVQTLQSYIDTARGSDEILFISQRQLITFDYLDNVTLVPEYELVELSARANLGDQVYLSVFRDDLRDHRFGLIVVFTLHTPRYGSSHYFGEENDSWVHEVSIPILCDYEPIDNIPGTDITLYMPLAESVCDPNP
jgi:hypothetical protein